MIYRRFCRRCEILYSPSGKFQKYCLQCQMRGLKDSVKKRKWDDAQNRKRLLRDR